MRKYNFNTVEVRQDGYVNIGYDCNGVTVINQSNGGIFVNECFLNGSPLNVLPADRFAGESLAIGGNEGEILTGRLQITFDASVTTPIVLLVFKYYLPE